MTSGEVDMRQHPLGIYEKALPKHLTWPERLALAKACGFDFVEMSVDESDERLARLSWSKEQRLSLVSAMLETGISIRRCACPVIAAFPSAAMTMRCVSVPSR
jgi:L-ribulose-5-phosphate 3-epimerase UlaE